MIHKNEEAGKEENVNSGLSLCRILRAAKLKYFTGLLTSMLVCTLYFFSTYCHIHFLLNSIADFFKELPQFVVKAGPTLSNIYGTDWENRLEVLTK